MLRLRSKYDREVRFEVHDLEEIGQGDADLIGISLGKNNHQKPAVIHTDIFEISLLYEKIELGIGMNKIRDFVPLISDIPLVNVGGT